jgi:hypothetical protein
MGKYLFLLGIIFISCNNMIKPSNTNNTPEEKWASLEDYMAPGAVPSNIRPRPDILSEQEVLLKAMDYAYSIGALNRSYFLFQEDPRLLNARIETPVLLYLPNGSPLSYMLMAVGENGESLMFIFVRPTIDADYSSFVTLSGGSPPNAPDYSSHFITKSQIIELIKSQFPDSSFSEPIALRGLSLEEIPYSINGIYWYFTVDNSNQNALSVPEEYIIAASVYRPTGNEALSRNAIASYNGSPALAGARMAKLETPLNLSAKIEAARSVTDIGSIPYDHTAKFKYTPVPLR